MDLLTGLRFRAVSHGVAAAYGGWLLRHFGAEVEHATALDPEGMGAFLGEGASFVPEPGLGVGPGRREMTRTCGSSSAATSSTARTAASAGSH